MKIYVVDFADEIQGVYLDKEKAKKRLHAYWLHEMV